MRMNKKIKELYEEIVEFGVILTESQKKFTEGQLERAYLAGMIEALDKAQEIITK